MNLATLALPPWVRLALKAVPWALLALVVAGLLTTRATLARVKLEHAAQIATLARQAAEATAQAAQRAATAADGYAARQADLQPLIVRSKDTVTTYAQTPAGRVPCLAAERVRGIDDLDASLFTPPGAVGRVGAVRPDAGASPAGRDSDER